MTEFKKLNDGWNTDPNVPLPSVSVDAQTLVLKFFLNSFSFHNVREGDIGVLRFSDCRRYRLGATNDEGWYLRQCRFSRLAPAWGEFYELFGDLLLDKAPDDWIVLDQRKEGMRHFLFYLRDDTFECDARDWQFTVLPKGEPA